MALLLKRFQAAKTSPGLDRCPGSSCQQPRNVVRSSEEIIRPVLPTFHLDGGNEKRECEVFMDWKLQLLPEEN